MEHKSKVMSCNLVLPSLLSFFAKGCLSCTEFKKTQHFSFSPFVAVKSISSVLFSFFCFSKYAKLRRLLKTKKIA